MKELDLNYVNRYAPYKVWTDNGRDYFVETDHDLLFKIGFVDDQSIWSEGAYQFTINNESNRLSPNDPKLEGDILSNDRGFLHCESQYSALYLRDR